jgi:hypothetical protein
VEIVCREESNSNKDFSPMPVTSEFALHAIFTSQNGSYLPFFSFGPSIKIPISKVNNPFVSDYSFSADVSIGFKKGLEFFNLSPELRYSHGLTDINLNPNLGSIKLHTMSLILNFN